tara:strand:- start:1861 stop:2787 length:927 start_codon:yes stop_codon:yes gene_type:complete
MEAVKSQSGILTKLFLLAFQAQRTDLSDKDRLTLCKGFKNLIAEFDTIARSTKHKHANLLSSDSSRRCFSFTSQVGFSVEDTMTIYFSPTTIDHKGFRLNATDISTPYNADQAETVFGVVNNRLSAIYSRLSSKKSKCEGIMALHDLEFGVQESSAPERIFYDNLSLVTELGLDSLAIAKNILRNMDSLADQATSADIAPRKRKQLHNIFSNRREGLQRLMTMVAWNETPLFTSETGVKFISQDESLAHKNVTFSPLTIDMLGTEDLKLEATSIATKVDAACASVSISRALNTLTMMRKKLVIEETSL